MIVRATVVFFLMVFPAFGSLSKVTIAQTSAEKPNILLIVGDDIGFGDIGISGSVTRTPNLDRLADQGLMFTSFHVSPVCSVTRAMLMTGNNPIEVGLGTFDYALYPPAEGKSGYEAYLKRKTVTIAELLHDAGYTLTWWASGILGAQRMVAKGRISGALTAANQSIRVGPTIGTRAFSTWTCMTRQSSQGLPVFAKVTGRMG